MTRYPRKIDRAAAERLLRGEPADPRHPDDLLAVLLATAAAPAHAGELAGEEAAVAVFRQARAAAAGCAARPGGEASTATEHAAARSRESVPVRKWITHPARLALLALTATTAGGVALAAASAPWSQRPSDQRPDAASPASSQPALPGSGQWQGPGGAGSATPHPSFGGLCRAFQAGAGTAPGKVLEKPAFTSLIKAAGGKDKVPAYCAAVLTAEAKRAKQPAPSGQATTPNQPSEADQSGQSGQSGQYVPTSRPTTKRPTVLPTPTVEAPSKTSPQHTRTPRTRL